MGHGVRKTVQPAYHGQEPLAVYDQRYLRTARLRDTPIAKLSFESPETRRRCDAVAFPA